MEKWIFDFMNDYTHGTVGRGGGSIIARDPFGGDAWSLRPRHVFSYLGIDTMT